METALVEPEKPQTKALATTTPSDLLRLAVEQGADLDKLERLMALQERWEAGQARKAFVEAMAVFKSDPPAILKASHVSYTKKDGSVTEYDHANLGDVCKAVIAGLSKVQISHRWTVKQTEGRILVTCILTHAQGHSETVELQANPDDSGGKNSIQAIGSTVTYLQRYTLLAATGLATNSMDDDGGGAGAKPDLITSEQVNEIRELIKEVGAKEKSFLVYLKVPTLEEIPAKSYRMAISALEAKRTVK